jgi:hypothetical protein
MDHQPLIPLQLLASEWNTTVEELIADLSPDQITVDVGVRYIARTTAVELLGRRNRAAQAQAQADAAYREHLDAMLAPTLRRVAAIQAQQRAARADGQIDRDTPAFVAMTMGDPNTRLERKGRLFEELLNAGNRGEYGTMHRFTPQEVQP